MQGGDQWIPPWHEKQPPSIKKMIKDVKIRTNNKNKGTMNSNGTDECWCWLLVSNEGKTYTQASSSMSSICLAISFGNDYN